MTWIWLGIVIVLILLELATVNLVTIWYIASAIVSLVLSLFVKNFFIQFLVFVLLGTILLITTRDVLLKIVKQKKTSVHCMN